MYRLHLAVDGASAPVSRRAAPCTCARPRATSLEREGTAPSPRSLCTGRASCARRSSAGTPWRGSSLLLDSRRDRTCSNIWGGDSRAVAPLRTGPVRVRISYGAPDAVTLRSRTLTLRLHRSADAPDPRVVGLRAVRKGHGIRVTWRTDRPTTYTVFWVTGRGRPAPRAEPLKVRKTERPARPAHDSPCTLTHADAIRYVSLRTEHVYTGRDPRGANSSFRKPLPSRRCLPPRCPRSCSPRPSGRRRWSRSPATMTAVAWSPPAPRASCGRGAGRRAVVARDRGRVRHRHQREGDRRPLPDAGGEPERQRRGRDEGGL